MIDLSNVSDEDLNEESKRRYWIKESAEAENKKAEDEAKAKEALDSAFEALGPYKRGSLDQRELAERIFRAAAALKHYSHRHEVFHILSSAYARWVDDCKIDEECSPFSVGGAEFTAFASAMIALEFCDLAFERVRYIDEGVYLESACKIAELAKEISLEDSEGDLTAPNAP